MCTAFLSLNQNKNYPLIILLNRDEYYSRQTKPAHKWSGSPIIGGLDQSSGGTWFAYDSKKHFALLTNIRKAPSEKSNAPSRGQIIPTVLEHFESILDNPAKLKKLLADYRDFNLLFGAAQKGIYFYSSRGLMEKLEDGIHALSNASLNSAWPKTEKGLPLFEKIIHDFGSKESFGDAFKMMTDQTKCELSELPETGLPHEIEIFLSSRFIEGEHYGTRSLSIYFQTNTFKEGFLEISFAKGGKLQELNFFRDLKWAGSFESFESFKDSKIWRL